LSLACGLAISRRRSWSLGRGAFSKIFFKFLARLKIRDAFGWNVHGFSGFRVAATTRASLAGSETSKPTQFNFFTFVKRADYGVKDGFDYHFSVALVQLSRASHFLHKFCLSHLSPVSRNGSAVSSFDYLISLVVAKKRIAAREPHQWPRVQSI
jgi:hypothetical protein